MPRRDGTGPEGEGPQTGRGLGPCNPEDYGGPRPRRFWKRRFYQQPPGQRKGQGRRHRGGRS